ncbi:hypothetical protein [Kocuria marina]|uniref:hypothetical protein n=1 Tax=Kocuria marina TaxID=223184 RepID=UPI0022DED2D2|nr:hypothetical protein [Kocuria marina]
MALRGGRRITVEQTTPRRASRVRNMLAIGARSTQGQAVLALRRAAVRQNDAHPPQHFTTEQLRAARFVTTNNGRRYPVVAVTDTGVTARWDDGRDFHLGMGQVYSVIS